MANVTDQYIFRCKFGDGDPVESFSSTFINSQTCNFRRGELDVKCDQPGMACIFCISQAQPVAIGSFSVSMGRGEFALAAARFEFYKSPILKELLPEAGPIYGGTQVA